MQFVGSAERHSVQKKSARVAEALLATQQRRVSSGSGSHSLLNVGRPFRLRRLRRDETTHTVMRALESWMGERARGYTECPRLGERESGLAKSLGDGSGASGHVCRLPD